MIQWLCKKFDHLNPHELYGILQLRNAVFVVEQNCVFQDADDKDQFCHHVMCIDNNKVIAYARIVPPGISYVETSIGRVVTSPLRRAEGLGKLLMEKSIEEAYKLYGKTTLKIGAQLYLKKFYESFGFAQTSEVYIEDDIPHIEMML
jgi:ElaA protein